ncbi:MAG: GNAT family N-acetyltransferase [Pseudomonadota bacterium]
MISTHRLILRSWQDSDLDALDTILGDPAVMAFSDRGALSRAEQAAWLRNVQAQGPTDARALNWAIVKRSEDQVIGYVRLGHDPARVERGTLELGIRVSKPFWGRGLGHEALLAVVEHARTAGLARRLVGFVDPSNQASRALLRRVGMSKVGEVMLAGYDYPDDVFAMDLGCA